MAVYLLIGSFFPKGDYTQILRLLELGEHFRLHVEEANVAQEEVSFSQFLQMHFLNTQIHQGDHEQDHENLPFHHINASFDQIVPPGLEMVKLAPPLLLQNSPDSACSLYFSEFPASIFHPPIAC